MGYTGGTTRLPTYSSIGDHTEAMRVYFDPIEVSFKELVRKFWAEHDPMPMAFTGTQYRSAVFVHSSEQREVVDLVRSELAGSTPRATALQHTKTEPVAIKLVAPTAIPLTWHGSVHGEQ